MKKSCIALLVFAWIAHNALYADIRPTHTLPVDQLLSNARNRRAQNDIIKRLWTLIQSGDNKAFKALIVSSFRQLTSQDLLSLFNDCYRDNHNDLVQWMLDATDIGSLRNDEGKTLLITAASYNQKALVRLLIACKNIDLDAQAERSGWTALMESCDRGYIQIVQLLLNAGANTQLKDFEGRDALWWAESSCKKEVVALLLAHKKQQTSRARVKI